MARHTPGPWTALDDPGAYSGFVYASDTFRFPDDGARTPNRFECCVMSGNKAADREELLANARLIAAAPDLYAALKDFMDGDGDVHAKVLAARAALEKATGGSR